MQELDDYWKRKLIEEMGYIEVTRLKHYDENGVSSVRHTYPVNLWRCSSGCKIP